MTKIYTLILIAAITFSSCKTASKAFEKGDYENAVSLAVKKLQKNGNDDATKALLKNAYTLAVQEHEAVIRNLSNSSSDSRYEKIYNEYRKLQNLYESVRNSSEASSIVTAVDYSSYVQTFKEKTGEVYFERGLSLMNQGDKASFRKAYSELKTAYRFKNDSEIKQKLDEAYEGAVVRVLLLTDNNVYDNGFGSGSYYGNGMYGNNSYNNYNTTYQIRNFQEDLVRNLRYQSSSEFVQFITDWETRNNNVQPDEIIEMRLGRLDMGRSYDETNSRDVSKQIVTRTIVYRPDSVVNEYANVYARINVTRRNIVSYGDLNITARDGNGKYLWSDIIRGEQRSVVEFASYTGDQRALSESDKALINNSQQNQYNNNNRREDIFRELLRQIEYEASNRFRNYYSRYY
jgi:hypothetical protein